MWISAPDRCEDNGINPVTGLVNGMWFQSIDINEIYVEQVNQYKCLPADFCNGFDLMSNDFDQDDLTFEDRTIEEKVCLQQVQRDNMDPNFYYCETIQVNLLINESGEKKVVSTTAYTSFEGGYDKYVCPDEPVYAEAAIVENSDTTEGAARFILQQSFVNLTDPCTWSCYEDIDGKGIVA